MDDFLKFTAKAVVGLFATGMAVKLGQRATEGFTNARKKLGDNFEIKL